MLRKLNKNGGRVPVTRINLNTMETFNKVLLFLEKYNNDPRALSELIEQLAIECNDEQIETALKNANDFLDMLNKIKNN